MIYLSADHGGYKLKEYLKKELKALKYNVTDLGPKKFVADDDYPDYTKLVAEKVSKNPNVDLGILVCRSGQGVNIMANKYKGVRSVLVWNIVEAMNSRSDNLANILSLPADFLSPQQALLITEKWLETPWGTEARHVRRVNKISKLEKK